MLTLNDSNLNMLFFPLLTLVSLNTFPLLYPFKQFVSVNPIVTAKRLNAIVCHI